MLVRAARFSALALASGLAAGTASAQADRPAPPAVPVVEGWIAGGDDPVPAPAPARPARQVPPGVGAEVIPGLSPIVAPPRRSKGTARPKRGVRAVEDPSLLRRA